MRISAKATADRIDRLVKLKRRIHALETKEQELVLAIRKAGGGQSKKWRAHLVTVAEYWAHHPRHRRLQISRV